MRAALAGLSAAHDTPLIPAEAVTQARCFGRKADVRRFRDGWASGNPPNSVIPVGALEERGEPDPAALTSMLLAAAIS